MRISGSMQARLGRPAGPGVVGAPRQALLPETALHLVVVGVALAVAAAWIARAAALGGNFAAAALLAYGVGAAIVLLRVRAWHPFPGFGLPNLVTTLRLALTALVAGLAADAAAVAAAGDAWLWMFVGLTLLALALDGVDGWAARRTGIASAFGARYDLEVDALLILLLAIVAWRLDKAGSWVVAIGLLRYGFVAAAWAWPWLEAPLPGSYRRKGLCVVQVSVLCMLLAPWLVAPLSEALAALALLALLGSFAVDVRWLYRRRPLAASHRPGRRPRPQPSRRRRR